MQNAIVINGRLTGPTHVELDEPVDKFGIEVEVILRSRQPEESASPQTIFEFLRQLPSGSRSRMEIDEEINQDRASWEGAT